MRTKHRIDYRFIVLFLAVTMLLTSFNMCAHVLSVVALGEEAPLTIRDDALHFYIRHWHSAVDDEALYQGSSNSNEDGDKDRYFVLVEGYIQPVANGDGYEFYMVNQQTGALIKYGDGEGENEMIFTDSPYIESVDEESGIIVLAKKPLLDGDDPIEKYAGLSISVGRNAVEYLDNGLLIKYDPYIHLVKGHAFYTPAQMIVNGAVATTVDGDAVTFEGLFADDEIDTAYVYTYLKSVTVGGKEYKAGDIVMSASNPDQACVSENDLPQGISKEDVQLSKFYSTLEGMHTDKTIVATGDDGRTFTSNLDVWYVEGHAPEVSLILDASGSMVSPTDEPTQISVYDTDGTFRSDIKASIQDKIGKLSSYGNSDAVDWNEVFLTDEELATIMNPRNTDNSMVGVSGYNYFIYNGSEYMPLGYWEGVVAQKADTVIDFQISSDNVVTDWPSGHSDLQMSTGKGFHTSGQDGSAAQSSTGIVLDAKPKNKNFTVSFDLITSTSGDPDTANRKIAELLYIGPISGSTTDGGYYRLIRDEAGNSNRLRGNQNPDRNGWVTDINNVFNTTATQRVTLVFKDGTITSYIDGNVGTGGNGVTNENEICELSDDEIYIILNGIADSYDGAPIYIDNVYVFDAALEADQINNITSLGTNDGLIGWYKFENPNPKPDGTNSGNTRYWLYNSIYGGNKDTDTTHYASKLTKQLNISNNSDNVITATTVAQRGDGKTLGSINTTGSDWTKARSTRTSNNITYTMSQTQAGWYFITHAGRFFNHYNLYEKDDRGGTGKRLVGIYGGYNNGIEVKDNAIDPHASGSKDSIGTGYTYTSTNDEPTRFYVDQEGNLRCFYSTASTSATCSYVYYLTDAQYVRTEVLRRAVGLFVTDLNAESPAAKVSAVRFSTSDINYDTIGTTDKFEMLLLQDWTSDTIESTGMLSMNYGKDSRKDGLPFVIGGARAYDYSTSRPKGQGDVKQYNYGLTGGTHTWSGIQSYINTLADTADPEAPKYLIIFTDGADDNIGNKTDKIKIQKGKDAPIDSVFAGDAAKELTDYLKGEGYTIFTVLLDGDSMKEGTDNFTKAKNFLVSLSGREGLTAKENEQFFFSINVSVSGKMDELVQELLEEIKSNYSSEEEFQNAYKDVLKNKTEKELTYSDLISDADKEIIDKAYAALDIHTTDLLTDIFTDEVLKEIVSPLDGYTVKDYIDPRFDLQNSDGKVWHLNAGGQIVIGDGSGENDTLTVSSTSENTFHLTGTTDQKARDPFLRYDAKKDMYYLEWVDQTIPTSAISADRLAIWTAQVILKAKDDFIGGNAILTDGNAENMNWVYHPGDLASEKDKADDEKDYQVDPLYPFGYDASSGTSDMKREYQKNEDDEETGVLIDAYPSKGFPRTTVNVQLLPINTKDIDNIIYMGEAVSLQQLLTEIRGDYITDSYYLDYLKRYAYQRYVKTKDETAEAEMDLPLFDLLIEWLEKDNDDTDKKEFSVPYMYLPDVAYDETTGRIDLSGSKANNTGTAQHEQDVVGILTYRWEQLNPDPISADEPIKDFVKNNTERVKYSLTVEFTPLEVGDTLEKLNSAVSESTSTTANGTPIIVVAIAGENGGETLSVARDGIFAEYIPLVGEKGEFSDAFLFDRETYMNNRLINEKDKDGKNVYQWNKEYKPAAYLDLSDSDTDGLYGNGVFINSGRTLTAFSQNTIDAVGGGIALELKVLIGELEEAVAKHDGNFEKEFTLNATRSFKDTDSIEKLKAEKYNGKDGNPVWEDFGNDFTITFKFDYDADEIDELKAKVLADPEKYPNGYVSIFAVATNVKANNANFKDFNADVLKELPIGTYDFSLNDMNEQLKDVLDGELHFATVGCDLNEEHFDVDYFDEFVLNGLHTTSNEGTDKWREKRDENGNIVYDKDGTILYEDAAEINNTNIADFIAEADTTADKKTASFYLGTVARDSKASADTYVPVRGDTGKNAYDTERYTNDRLGILLLSTGTARLTIKEDGAKPNESFLYRITGTTLGYEEVKDLIVSVKGGDLTTIDILPGTYTVEEISDWSWRYENKATYGKYDESDGDLDEKWTLYPNDLKKASTTLRYIDDNPIEEHKTVIYEHERNDKVWLGGENYENNHFARVQR